MGVTRAERGKVIDNATILFLVFSVLVLAGFAVWVTVVVRRASRLTRASDVRLDADLSSAVAEATGTAPKKIGVTTHDGAVMFDDELPSLELVAESGEAAAVQIAPPTSTEAREDSAPSATEIEARLSALADLHARGVITDDELAATRLTILAE